MRPSVAAHQRQTSTGVPIDFTTFDAAPPVGSGGAATDPPGVAESVRGGESPPAYQGSLSAGSGPSGSKVAVPVAGALELPAYHARVTSAPQARWLPQLSLGGRRGVEGQVALMLQRAEVAQGKRMLEEALLCYEAADKACAEGGLSYRASFFTNK